MIWVLDVDINQHIFTEHNELVEELKTIPDVVLRLEYRNFFYAVTIRISDMEKKHGETVVINYDDVIGKVRLEIYGKDSSYIIEKREAPAENNKKAISLLVGFTRYALAKITKDIKYINESETSRDDITKIRVIDVKVDIFGTHINRVFMRFLNLRKSCETIREYDFYIMYIYPHIAREMGGAILCCPNQCYLYVIWESQEGDYVGDKRFVIDLKGREPTEETLKEILKTRTDLLMNIEKYIRETLEKRKES